MSNSTAQRRGYADKLFVEQSDRRPVGPAGARAPGMHRLNGRFQLKSSGSSKFERFAEMALRLLHQRKRPLLRVLLGKRNVTAILPPARGTPRFTVQHESQQTLNLGVARHQLQKNASEPDPFLSQIAPALVHACKVIPADAEGGVNRFQHSLQPLGQITLPRDFKGNTVCNIRGVCIAESIAG